MGFTTCRNWSKFRGIFNGLCLLGLLFLFVYKDGVVQNPFSEKEKPLLNHDQRRGWRLENSEFYGKIDRDNTNSTSYDAIIRSKDPAICSEIIEHVGYSSECEYLIANPDCNSGGFLNYMIFFYCNCGNLKPLGYVVLGIWMLTLFYLLGNTAADYFCCCLEMLSNLLKLPPTVAGVTLLPLGNGAPDVFASIAAFVGRDSGDVGLNSVLGGAVFVTCIVVGAVSLSIADKNIQIDRKCFIRDVGFFLIALVSLLFVLVVGEVSVGGAIAFVSIYLVYAGYIGVTEILKRRRRSSSSLDSVMSPLLLPLSSGNVDTLVECDSHEMVDIISKEYLWGWNEEDRSSVVVCDDGSWLSWSRVCCLLEMPLAIPRRLTIPIVEERRWSKTFGVASAFFSPLLLAFLWSSSALTLLIGVVVGSTFGLLALTLTRSDQPPRNFLFPWVAGGFLMSIVWFYLIANELVALLVSLGLILRIKPSLLGLTILAWGNSMGDLMSNVAIATNGGHGVQVAMSGCYAGPMFNTLVGLGISLLLGAWSEKPTPYVLPEDSSLYFTLAFLNLSLIWSLIVLPRNDMRPSKLLGVGLMVIYLLFLSFRATIAMGDGSITSSFNPAAFKF